MNEGNYLRKTISHKDERASLRGVLAKKLNNGCFCALEYTIDLFINVPS